MTHPPIRILLVEDSPADADLVRRLLERAPFGPFHLATVDRIAKAVELLHNSSDVDLILLDVSLPDSVHGSLDSLHRIKAKSPELPIVLLTGVEDEELATAAVRLGAQDYLQKRQIESSLLGRSIRYALERKQAEVALRESEERYALAVQGAHDGLWDWHLKTDRIYFSPRWKSMLGFEDGEIGEEPRRSGSTGCIPTIADGPEGRDLRSPRRAARRTSRASTGCSTRTATYRWVLSRGIAVRDGEAYRMAGSQSDITARKAAEEQLLHDAFHDALTGLPNRALFLDRLGRAIARARRRGGRPVRRPLPRPRRLQGRQRQPRPPRRATSCSSPSAAAWRAPARRRHRRPARRRRVRHPPQRHPRRPAGRPRLAERVNRELAEALPRCGGHEVFTTASIGIALRRAPTTTAPRRSSATPTRRCTAPRRRARPARRLRPSDARPAPSPASGSRPTSAGRSSARSSESTTSRSSRWRAASSPGFEALVRWQHPERGLRPAGRVHPARRGDRPDHPARPAGCSARPAASCAEWQAALPDRPRR